MEITVDVPRDEPFRSTERPHVRPNRTEPAGASPCENPSASYCPRAPARTRGTGILQELRHVAVADLPSTIESTASAGRTWSQATDEPLHENSEGTLFNGGQGRLFSANETQPLPPARKLDFSIRTPPPVEVSRPSTPSIIRQPTITSNRCHQDQTISESTATPLDYSRQGAFSCSASSLSALVEPPLRRDLKPECPTALHIRSTGKRDLRSHGSRLHKPLICRTLLLRKTRTQRLHFLSQA